MTAEAEKLNVTQDGLEDPYKGRLEEIVKQINELNDGENTNNDKIENMSGVLTAEFSKKLSPETAKKLLEGIPNFSEGQAMPNGLQDLINFLEPIANNFSKSIEGELTNDEGTFKSKIDQKIGNNESELNKFKKTREDKEKKLFPEGQDIIDERLINIKGTIDKIKKIIERPNETNTKFLQKFIYENLDEDNKIKFAQKNCIGKIYNNDNFDGKFGISTLTYLDNVLQKIETYVKDVKESIAVEEKNKPSEGTEGEPFKSVKIKSEIPLPQGDNQIEAKDLLENLPDGAKAGFKGEKGIDKIKTEKQEITIVIRNDGGTQTREISITATVDKTTEKVTLNEGTGNPATPEATKPTAPEKITVNEEVHSIATEPPANKFGGALYYVYNGENPEALNNTLDENGDREYLMQVNNETYKVKLDQNGNLKPLAVNYESNAKVLLKNNPSCIAYLQNKIGNLPGNPQIAWNSNMEDYVIRSYGKGLTIEPMILDGKWASENLSQCLAFENFANFLRGAGGINDLKFKNDNPDLKLKDGKLFVRIKKGTRLDGDSKSGKWYEVNLQKFGISDNDAFNKFKKYNNGEDWKDNWDKKKDNKGYTKIDFPNVSGPADTPTTTIPTETTTIRNQYTDEEDITLGEVIVESTIFKPKNPIIGINDGENEWDFGDSHNAQINGLGKFENNNFIFNDGVIGESENLTLINQSYTKVDVNDSDFSGQGYYIGNIIRDKKDSSKNIKYLYYGGYENGLMSGQGTRIFDNGAKYEGKWEKGNENGQGKYTYTNGDTYEGNFVAGKFEGDGEFTFKGSGIIVNGKFKDNKFVSGNVTFNEQSYEVVRDERGLKITSEGENEGKYFDVKTGKIIEENQGQ